ncbi:phosphotransferase [Sphingobium boeckii]|uniref:CHK kinase-like domain-containing protein n=1 Tax=Sphingobium boeckii TaxID=1082345 RepID=A0A7W9AHX7_9SPHN|nr:phosphotransferase [Sphingobium boeckii]MBB5685903.1 hypothetical protein [Sphingobium boeckii]
MPIVPPALVRPGKIPRPQDVRSDWIQAMLARAGHAYEVADVRAEPVGTGQIGETARFTIDYAPDGRAGPRTLIGKFASTDPTSLQVASAWSLYEREVRFYHDLAARAGIATPAYFGAEMDEDGAFALLLEDLAPAAPGDQFKGLSEVNAIRAVQQAARLHAAFWGEGEGPELAWLDSGPLAQPFYSPDVLRATWPGFRDRYADHLTDDQRRVCDALTEHFEAYSRPLARPRCVTHNDFRPDNMLFDADRLVVVDWQSAALGSNAVDIAYLIGGAFSRAERLAIEPILITAYHDELRRLGISDYAPDELAADYRHFTFAGINVAVGAAMLVQRTERGDRMFLTMLDRHVSHVLDQGALSILTERH